MPQRHRLQARARHASYGRCQRCSLRLRGLVRYVSLNGHQAYAAGLLVFRLEEFPARSERRKTYKIPRVRYAQSSSTIFPHSLVCARQTKKLRSDMSARLLGRAWNAYLQKEINIFLAGSGPGYNRVHSIIAEDSLVRLRDQIRSAFESGKLFSPEDMARTDYIEIS